jgi:hypothetical protein
VRWTSARHGRCTSSHKFPVAACLSLIARHAEARRRPGVAGTRNVVLYLMLVDLPGRIYCLDRTAIHPVHSQVDNGPIHLAIDKQPCGMNRTFFATGNASIRRSASEPRASSKADSMAPGTSFVASMLPAQAACSPVAVASVPSADDPVKMAGGWCASMAMSWRYEIKGRCWSSRIACSGLCPVAIRSSACVPKPGSVIFWLAATPTPRRPRIHRDATAGDEEEIAAPNWPVSGQRATIEKVMRQVA